jgi:hypothetical protein
LGRAGIDLNTIDVANLARIRHVAATRALRDLVPQVRRGYVRAVFLNELVDAVLAEATAFLARHPEHAQLRCRIGQVW